MNDNHPVLKYFPHETFRDGQKETILQIAEYFEQGIENVCLEMPTGGGKSAIAFTLARWIGTFQNNCVPIGSACNYTNGKSYIITPQKILQDQYYNDIDNLILHDEMSLLKGKNNYECVLNKGDKADSCIMQTGKKCVLVSDCPYYTAERNAIMAQTAVLNYHMLNVFDKKLYQRCYSDKLGKIDLDIYERLYKRDLMVVDEAHNTEGFLMDLISVSIKLNEPEEQKKYLNETIDLPEVKQLLTASIENLYKYQAEIAAQISACQTDGEAMKLGKKISQIQNKIAKLEYLELTIENGNWAFCRDIRTNEENKRYCHAIECKPIFVANFAQAMIFRCARLKLFISATLPDKDVFCKSLGLNPDNTEYIRLDNVFPIESRKIYYVPTKSNYYAMTSKNMSIYGNQIDIDMIEMIQRIIEWDFLKNKKGIIITHTNKLMNIIMDSLYMYREFIPCSGSIEQPEDGEQRDMRLDAIKRHCNSPDPTILIGPNLYEGLDLKYDLARFNIMVKCPYPFEDEQIKARRERDYNWYYNNIGIKIVQGSGRTMRAKDDWTMNYLIDPGFDNFIHGRGSKFIPSYIKKSMFPMPKIFTN